MLADPSARDGELRIAVVVYRALAAFSGIAAAWSGEQAARM